jgi:hypothetical protein
VEKTKALPREAVLVVNARSRKGRDLFEQAKTKLEDAGVKLIAAHGLRNPKQLIPTSRKRCGAVRRW